MTAKKQTISYLQKRFQEIGFKPYAKHGQNFLIDLNILDLAARVAQIEPNDVVLEVGTGTGSLTVRIAERASHVVTVEIDPHLAQMAVEQFDEDAPITLLQYDVLRNKNRLRDEVLETVREKMAAVPDASFKLVANLPYSVATPIISNLLASDLPPDSMTVTIQKELADRLIASPRTKDYGSLSVWVQAQAHALVARELAPTVFWPRPKVTSAIVQIVLDRQKRAEIGDLRTFQTYVRGVFLLRRKFLRSALLGAFKSLDKPSLDPILARQHLGPEARAEELTVEQHLALAKALAPWLREPADA
ncbi:MAG: ribosomal RNA small subunit methyltransferase A [Planctomycetales bacterium]|nr:ribosomal RNA small subunit methyltransferase A [Planctomycetales bacterium]MCA9169304.1 ribosomal RNA small subunit methyltransferase A [Planctomycetales bacterium]